jgi:hypothetical protein
MYKEAFGFSNSEAARQAIRFLDKAFPCIVAQAGLL